MTTLENKTSSPSRREETSGNRRTAALRPHVIAAVSKRNFSSYLSNPAGYVFITLFVFVCSLIAFCQPRFFTNNLANLELLNEWMPYLLLFFVPAITMTLWAEERKQGTDELLFTLPARDLEVVLGKYLAALGIYTVALAFLALGQVPLLSYLLGDPNRGALFGKPDLGVLFATYFGYWLTGAMLISVGMVASLLSSNVTVAFILGALFSAIPIFAGLLGSPFPREWRRQLEDLSVPSQFHDFGTGVIPLAGVFYFVSLVAAMLYINMLLVGRRHWAGGEKSRGLWVHSLVRALALIVALASLNVLMGRSGVRADTSTGRLNTLSRESVDLIKQIPKDRPVYIQAYYSPEVPPEYIEVKNDLISLLKEYAAWGGDRIRLNLIETELYTDTAREAEKRFGITPKRVMSSDEAKQSSSEIFLGVAFSSGVEEVVIPFFDRGLPVEYELTRSIRVVSRTGRKKVGILSTDAKLMGGFDMRTMGQNPEWSIVTELKKQYDVSSVSPDSSIPGDVDVLLVAQPSSLSQKQIDNLTDYVKSGKPALLFLDPFPVDNPQLSPEVPKMPPGGPFGGGPPPEPKGDLKPLLDLIGLEWPTTEIVWNEYNPLPQMADLPPEIVFVSKSSGAADAFNPDQVIASGLQEVVLLFPGLVRPRSGSGPEFIPLLRTDSQGGIVAWSEATQQGFMGISGINPNRRHFPTGTAYTLAARLKGTAAESDKKAPETKKDDKSNAKDKPAEIHVIAIADLDLISEQFFEMRRRKIENLDFDNVTFVLNCVDELAGDEAFIGLRKRRTVHRTLQRVEAQSEEYIVRRQKETKAAEEAAKEKLDQAQKRLDQQVEAVRARKDMDDRTKEIMLANLQEVANRRLDVEKANIEDEKRIKIQDSKAETERAVREIQNQIRGLAAVAPILPPILLGFVVFGVRFQRENLGANPNRLA